MGNSIKTDKQERRNCDNGENGEDRSSAFRKDRCCVAERETVNGECAEEKKQNACAEHKGEDDLECSRKADTAVVEYAEEQDCADHQDDFTRVNFPARQRVKLSHLKDSRKEEAAEKG